MQWNWNDAVKPPPGAVLRPAFARLVSHGATAWLVLLISLGATALAWYAAHVFIERRAHDRFLFQSETVATALSHRMQEYAMALRGGVALFAASRSVERDEWHQFVAKLDLPQVYPGIQGMGFSRVVSPEGLAGHEAAIRAEGFPDYHAWPRGDRPLHTAIVYLEPFDWRNRRAFGYDMASEPVRREAMERARDSGVAAASGIVTLVQETEKDVQKGFLLYLPVYRNGVPTSTLEQRRAALEGFVYSPFRVKDLMRALPLEGSGHLAFGLFQGKQAKPSNQIYDSGLVLAASPVGAAFEHEARLDMFGQVWTLRTQALPGFLPPTEVLLPRLVLVGSLLADILLFLYVRSLASREWRAGVLARSMTRELRESEERQRTLVEHAPDAIVVMDEKGIILSSNPAARALFGYAEAEMRGRNVSMLMPSAEREAHDGYLERYLASGQPRVIGAGREVRAQRKDGSQIEVHLKVGEQRLPDGGRLFVGFMRDISERVRADAALKERQALLHSLIETSSDGFWSCDMDGNIVEVNDEYCRRSGYSREQLLVMNIRDLEADEHPEETARHMARVIAEGSDLFESRHRTKSGEFWPVEVSVSFSPAPVARFVVFCRDISERKRSQAELEGHRYRLEELVGARTAEVQAVVEQTRLILSSTADGIYGMDGKGCFTFVNPACCVMLGFSEGELLGQNVHGLIHHSRPDGAPYPEAECSLRQVLTTGEAVRSDHDVYWRRDGQALHVAAAARPMLRDGQIVGAVVSFTDIRERLRTEEALRRQADELRQQNDTLEQFNRIMVGRELDMIRLKGRVNELSRRLGEVEPFDLSFAEGLDAEGGQRC